MPRGIELVVHRDPGHGDALPGYSIYAGNLRVGAARQVNSGRMESWAWRMDGLTLDPAIGMTTGGYADSLAAATAKVRVAVERWLEWARAVSPEDAKHSLIQTDIAAIGAALGHWRRLHEPDID